MVGLSEWGSSLPLQSPRFLLRYPASFLFSAWGFWVQRLALDLLISRVDFELYPPQREKVSAIAVTEAPSGFFFLSAE